jgi:hypothetical protein
VPPPSPATEWASLPGLLVLPPRKRS